MPIVNGIYVKPAQFDVIDSEDWDNIQSQVEETLGPIGYDPVFDEYTEGVGYGVQPDQLYSRPYPFTRTITDISNESFARLTFDAPHRLVNNEVLYLSDFSDSAWSVQPINGAYVRVTDASDTNSVLVNFNTTAYPNFNGTARSDIFLVSANEFNNLRIDTARLYRHVYGAAPTTADLPDTTSLRGTVISYNVFDPFYDTIDAVIQKKFVLGDRDAYYDDGPEASFTRTADWNGSLELSFTLAFDSKFNYVQFFNTGGHIQFSLTNVDGVATSGSNRILDENWRDFFAASFPVNYGAYGASQMGYTDGTVFTNQGGFEVPGTEELIYERDMGVELSAVDDTNSVYRNETIKIWHKRDSFQRAIDFRFEFNNVHDHQWARNVGTNFRLRATYIYPNPTGGVRLVALPENSISITGSSGWA